MMRNDLKWPTACARSGLIWLLLVAGNLWPQLLPAQAAEPAPQADSTIVYPKKMPNKNTWETIVSMPGTIMMLPIHAILFVPEVLGGVFYEGDLLNQSLDLLVADDSSRGLLPMWSSRYGGGFNYFHRDIGRRGSEVNLFAQLGPLWRQRYAASYGFGLGPGLMVGLKGSYTRLPNESFFGIGSDSKREDKSNYLHELSEFNAFLRSRRVPHTEIMLEAGLDFNNFFDGNDKRFPQVDEKFDITTIPGYENKIELVWLSAKLSYHRVNRPGSPTRGWKASGWGRLFGEIGDSRYEFAQMGADIETYLNLFHNRYLVFRLAGQLSRPFKNRVVPFQYYSRLGIAEETIRGYERDRFIDRDLALGSVEYRWPVYRLIDAVLFVETATVAHDIFDEASSTTWHTSYGGGLRLWSKEGLLADLYLAKSRDGVRLHFSMNTN